MEMARKLRTVIRRVLDGGEGVIRGGMEERSIESGLPPVLEDLEEDLEIGGVFVLRLWSSPAFDIVVSIFDFL
jgi:hypothetical protein